MHARPLFRNGVVVVVGLATVGCQSRPPDRPRSTPSPAPSPVPVAAELTGAHTVLSDKKGNRVLELIGGAVTLPRGAELALLQGTRAVVYQAGKPALTITAKTVRVEPKTQKLLANGGVVAKTPDAREVRCDNLTWSPHGTTPKDPKAGTLAGSGNVAFLAGSMGELFGSRFTADTLLEKIKLLP